MRFKRLDTHEHEVEKSALTKEKAEVETKPSLIELGSESKEEQEEQKASVPAEWKSLATFIETERARQPTPEYLEGFWGRLLPRLKKVLKNEEAVREYLRRTFWSRWSLRLAVAATILFLLLYMQIQKDDMRALNQHLNQLEQQMRTTQPGL
jgi:hypothetical protein